LLNNCLIKLKENIGHNSGIGDFLEVQIALKGFKVTPINRLYKPIIKNKKPSIVLSSEARNSKKKIQNEIIAQNQNILLHGDLTFRMNLYCKDKRCPDIDALQKIIFDSLEGLCFENDKQIKLLTVRKFESFGEDLININIKEL